MSRKHHKTQRINTLKRYRKIANDFNKLYEQDRKRIDDVYDALKKELGYSKQTIDRALAADTSILDENEENKNIDI